MHDIKAIRENPARFDANWARRGLEAQTSQLLALDEALRAAIAKKQAAETQRNAASKQIGAAKAKGDEAEFERLRAQVADLKTVIEKAGAQEKALGEKLRDKLLSLPNLLADDVPEGEDEGANRELRVWGMPRDFDFEPKDHTELGEALGQLDFERAAKISGARFAFLKGDLARLERALGAFMLDVQTQEHGFLEVAPPLLVRDAALYGTAQLPKFGDDLFEIKSEISDLEAKIEEGDSNVERLSSVRSIIHTYKRGMVLLFEQVKNNASIDNMFMKSIKQINYDFDEFLNNYDSLINDNVDLINYKRECLAALKTLGSARHWLIPTAEVPLTNLAREAIHDEAGLPQRYCALTPCFRSEAGSAGKDTRGLIRMHQFMKVEMVAITTPEKSWEEHERMTGCAEAVLQKLELPYRVMVLSAGDTGFGAQKTHDLEVWLPSQGRYREISSVSNCGDFQARRMNARCRATGSKKTRFVHTLNGSGVAVGRALLAVVENYQNADGSITVPAALRPYMGGQEVIAR